MVRKVVYEVATLNYGNIKHRGLMGVLVPCENRGENETWAQVLPHLHEMTLFLILTKVS